MTENELVSFIKKCQREHSDSAILLPDKTTTKIALNLLLNSSSSDTKVLLLFDENGRNSGLFDLIESDIFIKNTIDFLKDSNADFFIASNKVKTIRKSMFFNVISDRVDIKDRLKVRAINDYINSDIKSKRLNNEFIITGSNAILFGDFSFSGDSEPYLNFNDKSFNQTLGRFFDIASTFDYVTTSKAKI
ncbi:hypothetical protein RAL73_003565 [Vibrio cholerae]|nr:hypothetical protein [Vibrio cholerae]EGR0757251.1 hypothetical protein [Vibrio cholerae]EGR0821009.1 hypothetical protein [Vibrio cholerae]EJM7234172.1 hypothetical protein [Vibrio cholerae]ELG4677947.1 hypothetical protein [Vibrio cholerae]